MSSDILDPVVLDFSKNCRLCLQHATELSPIFPETEPSDAAVTSLATKIMACVSIEVTTENSNMPKQVCSKCVQQIDSWVKFKELCDSANALLHQCVANLQASSSEDAETLKYNLQGPDTILSDMDVSIFERDSLFGAFEDGSLPLSEDLNASFSEILSNQKNCQTPKKNIADNNFINSTNNNNNKNMFKNILSNNQIEILNPLEEHSKDITIQKNNASKYRQKYDEFYKKNYPCNICKKIFSKFTLLLHHDKLEHSEFLNDINCGICGMLFVSKSRVDIHMLKHSEKQFECPECHRKMLSKKSLAVHMKLHSSNNNFICKVCGAAKLSKRMLDDHVRSVHSKETPFRCDLCGKQFSTEQNRNSHYNRHVNKKLFKCNICGSLSLNANSYKSHLDMHKNIKDIVCDTCGKLFKSNQLFHEHMKTHNSEKPFKCLICSFSFSKRYLLVRHEATHLGLRPHSCSYCNKSFKRKDLLTAHIRIHTGERKYSCNNCLNKFLTLRSLKRHQRKCTITNNVSTNNLIIKDVLIEKSINTNNNC